MERRKRRTLRRRHDFDVEPSASSSPLSLLSSPSKQQQQQQQQQQRKTPPIDTRSCVLCGGSGGDALRGPLTTSGSSAVHLNCARWSRDVVKHDGDDGFERVAEAAKRAARTTCEHCSQTGASIQCEYSLCKATFHLQCLFPANCLRMRGFHTFCSRHGAVLEAGEASLTALRSMFGVRFDRRRNQKEAATEAEMRAWLQESLQCELCESTTVSEETGPMLSCVECGMRSHRGCVAKDATPLPETYGPAMAADSHAQHVALTEAVRPWRCGECLRCQVCLSEGDEACLLTCDACDDGYHYYCATPALQALPRKGWRCEKCVYCLSCGARTPSSTDRGQWHLESTSCSACSRWRSRGYICPVCRLTYHEVSMAPMVQCDRCNIWVHATCDNIDTARFEALQNDKYLCPPCRAVDPHFVPAQVKPEEDDVMHVDGPTPSLSITLPLQLLDEQEESSQSSSSQRKAARKRSKKGESEGSEEDLLIKISLPSTQEPFVEPVDEPVAEQSDATADVVVHPVGATMLVDRASCPAAAEVCVSCFTSGISSQASNDNLRSGQSENMIACLSCGESYHAFCAFPPDGSALATKDLSRGWHCLTCLVCSHCDSSFPESSLLVCDSCERGFHTGCLQPPLAAIPSGVWLCRDCIVCLRCGQTNAADVGDWNYDMSLCGACATMSTQLPCCICAQPIHDDSSLLQLPWLSCNVCSKRSHGACDGLSASLCEFVLAANLYRCPTCRSQDVMPRTVKPAGLPAIPTLRQFQEQEALELKLLRLDTPMEVQFGKLMVKLTPKAFAPETNGHHAPNDALAAPDASAMALPVPRVDHTDDLLSCVLCGGGESVDCGRLLLCSKTQFIHVRCAVWSAEVVERDGLLFNVGEAISRGKRLRCSVCQKTGATTGCRSPHCSANYHYRCALQANAGFYSDGSVKCTTHAASHDDPNLKRILPQELAKLARPYRCEPLPAVEPPTSTDYWRSGALSIAFIGQTDKTFSLGSVLVAPGFSAQRIFWRSVQGRDLALDGAPLLPVPSLRMLYTCSVVEDGVGGCVFRIAWASSNHGAADSQESVEAANPSNALQLLLQRLSPDVFGSMRPFRGEHFFGLTLSSVQDVLRASVRNVSAIPRLRFTINDHKEPPVNKSGCARCEMYDRAARPKRFAFLSSSSVALQPDGPPPRPGQPASAMLPDSLLPMAMRYRHLRLQAKRRMRVLKSPIQGWGLFTTEDIEKGEMCIEYIGDVIGIKVSDKREKMYERKGIGCYMFRLDETRIVDATFAGNSARFINHSCDPNCFSRIMYFDGEPKIIILSKTKIKGGTELTYNYQMPIEEVKLPCRCGAANCNGYMN